MLSTNNLSIVLILITLCCTTGAASARGKFSDPGVLLNTKTIYGTTYEQYSDGLSVEYTLKGYRKEENGQTTFGSEMTPPPNGDPELWTAGWINFPDFSAPYNDAALQSKLRQHTEICLSRNHAAKALKEAKRYLEIQQTIKAPGLPLAIGQELLGRVYVEVGEKEPGLRLLELAKQTATAAKNEELKNEIQLQLSLAKNQPADVSTSQSAKSAFDDVETKTLKEQFFSSASDQHLLKQSPILLLLDRSETEARKGDFQKAKLDAVEAITLCSRSEPLKPAGINRAFNEAYRKKITDIAEMFSEQKDRSNEAMQLLLLANSKIKTGASADVDLPFQTPRYYGGFYALIDTSLAKLYLSQGRTREAYAAIHSAIAHNIPNNVSESTLQLAGELAEKNRQFEIAAQYFSQAEIANSSYHGQSQLNTRVSLLRKASACYRKTPSPNKNKLANISIRLGLLLENSHPQEALQNYEFAYLQVSDSNYRKAKLLARIEHVKSLNDGKEGLPPKVIPSKDLTNELIDPVVSKRLKHILSQPPHQSAHLTEEQMIANVVRESAQNFGQLMANARKSEKSNRADAWRSWRDFATAEAQIGNLDSAVKDAHHAIALYKGDGIPIYDPAILVTAGDIRTLANTLRRQGRDADAQALLKEALSKLAAEHGSKSSPVATQYATVVAYDVSSNSNSKALKTLDEMLELPARVIDVGGRYQSGVGRLYEIVRMLHAQKRDVLAREILNRIMKSQIKQLGHDDYRLSTTEVERAQFEQSAGAYNEAARNLFDAIRIRILFDGLRSVSEQTNELEKLLPKIGRSADNKWVDVPSIGRLCPSIMRQFDFAAEAEALEKTGKLPKSFVDPQYSDVSQRLASDDDLQNEGNSALRQAPYSYRTYQAYEMIMHNSLQSNDWKLLARSGDILVSIYEHRSDQEAGRRIGCVIPRTYRIDYYLAVAKAKSKMGKRDEALRWLDRASKVLPDISCNEYQSLGEMAIELGSNVMAKQFLDRSKEMFLRQKNLGYCTLHLAYKKIGDTQSANEIKAKLDAEDLENKKKRAESNAQEHIFDHVQL